MQLNRTQATYLFTGQRDPRHTEKFDISPAAFHCEKDTLSQ